MDTHYKKNTLNKVTYRYSSDWCKTLESQKLWNLYWHQQKIMEGLIRWWEKDTILELGIGSGFTANYCKSKGLKVTTIDIDPDKTPDIVANAVTYDFTKQYDYFLAFEVLEHMPFVEAETIVNKIPKFTKRYAFVSIPRNEKTVFEFKLKLPGIRNIEKSIRVRKKKITTQTHFWEVDYGSHTRERIEKLFRQNGLEIVKVLKYDYILFYALEVKRGQATR